MMPFFLNYFLPSILLIITSILTIVMIVGMVGVGYQILKDLYVKK